MFLLGVAVQGKGRMRAKAIVLVVILASVLLLIPRQSLVSAADTSNSRGIWSFDEGMGNEAHDTSGNANDGTIHGGATWVDGRVGKALSFDGSSGYVQVPDSDSLDVTGKLTLEAWISPKSLTHAQVIVCKYNHTSLSSSFYLSLGGTFGTILYLNKIYFALTYDGNHYYAMISNANVTANTWTHVAATSNGTHMSIYINGVSDKVRTYPPGNIYAGSAKLRIGCYLPEAGYGRFFDGALDEVRVAAGVVWTVDDDKVQCPNADFTAIQPAVNAAGAGDTVLVHAGTYLENVNIPLAIALKSVSRPIIDGNKAGTCITIAADGVTVDGFELTNGTNGIFSYGTDRSVVSNNLIHDIFNALGYAGCGIMFWSDSAAFYNNTIGENEIYNCDRQGIYLGWLAEGTSYISEGNVISGNRIHNNGRYTYPNGPDASAYGIQLCFADRNTICNNKIYGHDDWFPYPVEYPTYDFAQGIYLYESNDNSLTGNYLCYNNYGIGIYCPTRVGTTNVIHYNDIAGNTGYGLRSIGTLPLVDARYNWWGNGTGPTHASNAGGTGDLITDNVEYRPWLGARATRYIMKEDVNADGVINILDVVAVSSIYGAKRGDPIWNPYADIDADGVITILDIVMVTRTYGTKYDP